MTQQQILHVAQVSLEAFDSPHEITADVEATLATEPNAANFTEVTKKNHRDELATVCKRHGYLLRGGVGDTAIALRPDHKLLDFDSHIAHSGGRDSYGNYGTRTLEVLTAGMDGETVTIIGGHWVRPRTPERRRKHAAMTDLAIELMVEHSIGTKIALVLGDLNENDTPNERLGSAGAKFNAAGITTLWDELGVYPGTGPSGGTIDLLASANGDRRVQAVGVHVWRLGNSDHHRVSGFYGIRSRS